METYNCRGCPRTAKFFCMCQAKPILLCPAHLEGHRSTSGVHGPKRIFQALSEAKRDYIIRGYGWLQSATQQSLTQLLSSLESQAICDFAEYETREILMSFASTSEESRQKGRDLVKVMTLGWDNLELPEPRRSGRNLVSVFLTNLESRTLKVNCRREIRKYSALQSFYRAMHHKEKGRIEKAWELYQEVAAIQKELGLVQDLKRTLYQIVRVAEETDNNPFDAFRELISICPSQRRDVADLNSIFSSSVKLSNLVSGLELKDHQIYSYQVYKQLVKHVGMLGINESMKVAQQPIQQKKAFYRQYKEFLTQLAFSALNSEKIYLDSMLYQDSTFQDVYYSFRFGSIFIKRLQEESNAYQFAYRSLRDFVIAERTLQELDRAVSGGLHQTTYINTCNFAKHNGISAFIVQMVGANKKRYEHVLLDIVLQTRHRDTITQAAANAMTLLNRMNYCFAGHDFSRVKIPGADLFGADLSTANFEASNLESVKLHECQLTWTNLERANLKGARFGRSLLKGYPGGGSFMCFSVNGVLLASANSDSSLIVWDMTTGQQVHTLTRGFPRSNVVAFSSDGALIASSISNDDIALWNTNTGQQLYTLPNPSNQGQYSQFGRLTGLCFSFDNRLIASSDTRAIFLWEVATAQIVFLIEIDEMCINALCFSYDGSMIVAGGDIEEECNSDDSRSLTNRSGRFLVFLDTETGNFIRERSVDSDSEISFSPDGRLVATFTETQDETIGIWGEIQSEVVRLDETDTGRLIGIFDISTRHGASIGGAFHNSIQQRAICFLGDDTLLVSDSDGKIGWVHEVFSSEVTANSTTNG